MREERKREKKRERERETTVERKAPHKALTKTAWRGENNKCCYSRGTFTFTLCFSYFEHFKNRYLSCSLCLGACSCSRGFGLEMPVRTGCLNAELMLPSCGLWIWGLLSALLLAGQSGACPPHCSCTGTTVDCHGLAFKSVPRNIPKNTERL